MNMKNPPVFHKQRSRRERGFTLLLAALVASIVLGLGAAIFQLAQKQLILSSIGRDSQFAFYAADTAAECALYWDFRYSYFGTTTPSGAENPLCDLEEIGATGRSETFPYTMTSAQMNFFQDASPSGGYCAQVFVTKSIDPTTSAIRTLVHADGYSINCDSILTSPRALQRSVELHY